ncbi:hypothetical protein ES703_58737 [subsurface metagenome]
MAGQLVPLEKWILAEFFLKITSEAIQRYESSDSIVLDGVNSSKIPAKELVRNRS